jgi:hypothetical protein
VLTSGAGAINYLLTIATFTDHAIEVAAMTLHGILAELMNTNEGANLFRSVDCF